MAQPDRFNLSSLCSYVQGGAEFGLEKESIAAW